MISECGVLNRHQGIPILHDGIVQKTGRTVFQQARGTHAKHRSRMSHYSDYGSHLLHILRVRPLRTVALLPPPITCDNAHIKVCHHLRVLPACPSGTAMPFASRMPFPP